MKSGDLHPVRSDTPHYPMQKAIFLTIGIRMITPYNVLYHELIGLEATVEGLTDKSYRCKGTIVEETRNTLKIESGGKTTIVPKNCVVLEVKLPEEAVVRIEGKLLIARPEDRIKKKFRIKFV